MLVRTRIKELERKLERISPYELNENVGDIKRDLYDLREAVENSGVIVKRFFGFTPNVNVEDLENKVNLLIDHLKLEYKPEHQCGPTLTKKKKKQ